MEGSDGEERDDEIFHQQVKAKAKEGLLRGVCNALILQDDISNEIIQDAIKLCLKANFHFTEDEVIAEIESQMGKKKEQMGEKKEEMGIYYASSMHILQAMHHTDNIMQEVTTLVSELAGNRDASNICDNILKRCVCQKGALDEMLVNLRSSCNPTNVSGLDAIVSEDFGRWISDAPWQSEQTGSGTGEETNTVTEDDSKDTEAESDASAEEMSSGSEEEKFDGSEEKRYDSEDTLDVEEKCDDSWDERKEDPEQGSDDDQKSNESVEYNRGSGGARGGRQNDDTTTHNNAQLFDERAFLKDEHEKYEEIKARFSDRTDDEFVAATTSCELVVLLQIEWEFSAGCPRVEKVHSVTNSFINILEPLSNITDAYAEVDSVAAGKQRAAKVAIGRGMTWGSIAVSCAKAEKAEGEAPTLSAETTALIKKVEKAVKSYRKGANTKRFTRLGYATRNVVANLSNISIGLCVFCELALCDDVFDGLSNAAKSEELKKRAKDLAAKIRPDEPFYDDTKVIDFVEIFLAPALADDELEEEAVVVALDIKYYLTQTGGQRGTKIRSSFKRGQANKADGERNEGAPDYCGGNSKLCSDNRRRIVSILFNLLLRENIKRRLPNGALKYPFSRYLLYSSPSDIDNYCKTERLFGTKYSHNDTYETMETHILKSYKKEYGERNVIITSENQICELHKMLP